jgi:hypothetical protein
MNSIPLIKLAAIYLIKLTDMTGNFLMRLMSYPFGKNSKTI